jgi:hypothetical protein
MDASPLVRRESSPLTYRKGQDSGYYQHQYEKQVALLVSLRCANNNKKFHLAADVDGVGDSDNLVIECELEEGVWMTFFVQLELRQNNATITRRKLRQISGPFSLLRLFESYCLIRKGNGGILKFCGSVDDLEFILYTSAMVEYGAPVALTDRDPLRILSSGSEGGLCTTFSIDCDEDILKYLMELSRYKKFLRSPRELFLSKKTFRYDEIRHNLVSNDLIKKVMNCDFSFCGDFLKKLKILQRQSPLSDVDELLSEELKEYVNKAASGESLDTNSICQQIRDNFIDWWHQTGKVHWLSESSDIWQTTKKNVATSGPGTGASDRSTYIVGDRTAEASPEPQERAAAMLDLLKHRPSQGSLPTEVCQE